VSGLEQLQYLSWLLYLFVFAVVLARTVRRPTRAHIDMTLFFGATAIVIVATTLTEKFHLDVPSWVNEELIPAAAAALGYLLLRLVNDFSHVPTMLLRAVELGMLASIAAIVFAPGSISAGVALALVLYLVAVIAYDAWAFARHASRSRGVTRRRMQAAAAGSWCLAMALIIAGVGIVVPSLAPPLEEVGAALGVGSGICYFVSFAPPTWLRRAWQEPEVRAFLARAAKLARLPDMRDVVGDLERGAADALGASGAKIALWDPDAAQLKIFADDDAVALPSLPHSFQQQRPTLVTGFKRADAPSAALVELYNARAILAAPVTAYGKRLGVLLVYAPRAPVFASSDLELIQLLGDHVAMTLENRLLVDEAAQVRAREEATRLKEDFLSSAAHDLKTPLTGIVTQAQIMRRRAQRDPSAPPDPAGLERLLEQSQRLKSLVLELLDVSRLEHGSLIGERQQVELAALVRSVIQREAALWKRVKLRAESSVVAELDAPRFEQALINLVENALKYSQPPLPVIVEVWCDDGEARLSVRDEGIGIPAHDQPLVFERFHRARNVDDRRFAGMGLGLYIARGIIEQHGGRIWVESTPGVGSTFFVALPVLDAVAEPADTASEQVMQ